jgi:hypothetical protein
LVELVAVYGTLRRTLVFLFVSRIVRPTVHTDLVLADPIHGARSEHSQRKIFTLVPNHPDYSLDIARSDRLPLI